MLVPEHKVEIAGLTWQFIPIEADAQFEVECILLRAAGPPVAAVSAAFINGLAPPVIEIIQETTGKGTDFDLAKLGDLDTSDPRLKAMVSQVIDAVAATTGDMIRDGVLAAAGRLDHRDIMRLMEILVLSGKAFVYINDTQHKVTDYAVLSRATGHKPLAKWEVLMAALATTYAQAKLGKDEDAQADTGSDDG